MRYFASLHSKQWQFLTDVSRQVPKRRQQITTTLSVITQKSIILIYFAAEACNQDCILSLSEQVQDKGHVDLHIILRTGSQFSLMPTQNFSVGDGELTLWLYVFDFKNCYKNHVKSITVTTLVLYMTTCSMTDSSNINLGLIS